MDRDEAAASADNHPHRVGVHRRDGTTQALGDVEQPEALSEQEVHGSDDVEGKDSDPGDVFIVTEQADP